MCCSPHIFQECIRCLEHSPEGTQEASKHYQCTGAIYEVEHTLKYLTHKEQEDERMNEERRLRREEAEDRWKKLEKDVEAAEAAKEAAKKGIKAQPITSTAVKPDDVTKPDYTRSSKLLLGEEKTVEEWLMEDDDN